MSRYHKTSSKTLEERVSDIHVAINKFIEFNIKVIPKESHELLFGVIAIIKEDFRSLFEEAIKFPEIYLDVRQKRRNNTLDQDLQKNDVSKEFRSLGEKCNKLRDHIKYADSKYKEKHGGEFLATICLATSKFSIFIDEEVERIILEKNSILKKADSNKERKEKTVSWALDSDMLKQEESAHRRLNTILGQGGSRAASHSDGEAKEEKQLKPNPVTSPQKGKNNKGGNVCNIL